MADLAFELGEAELDYNEEQTLDEDGGSGDGEDGEIDDLEDGELKEEDEEEEDSGLERGEVPLPPPMFTGGTPLKSPILQSPLHSPEKTSMPPCKFFAKGLCTWGNECKFVHAGGSGNRGNYQLFPDPAPPAPRLPPPPHRVHLPPPPPLAPPPPPVPPGPIPPQIVIMRPRLPPPPPRPPIPMGPRPGMLRPMLRPPPGFPIARGPPPPRPFPPIHLPIHPPPPLPCPPAPLPPPQPQPAAEEEEEEEESAWEKGLKRAKELIQKATEKKEMEREAEERARENEPGPVKRGRTPLDEVDPSRSPLRPPTPPEGFPPIRRDYHQQYYDNPRGRYDHGASRGREVTVLHPEQDYYSRQEKPPFHHHLPPPPARRNHDHPPPKIFRGTSQRHNHHGYPPPIPRYEDMEQRKSEFQMSPPGSDRTRRYSNRSGPEPIDEYSRSRSNNSEGEPYPPRHYRRIESDADYENFYHPDHPETSSRVRRGSERRDSRRDGYPRQNHHRRTEEEYSRREGRSGRKKESSERTGRELPYERRSYGGGEWKDPWERRKDRKTRQSSSSYSSASSRSRSSRSTSSSPSSSRSPSSSPGSSPSGHRRRRYRGRERGRVASKAAAKALRARKNVLETEEGHPLIKKKRESSSQGPSLPAPDPDHSPPYDPEDPVERNPIKMTLFNKTRMRPNVSNHEEISEDESPVEEAKEEEGERERIQGEMKTVDDDSNPEGKETRREELLKQLKAVEDAIAKKRDPVK